jgi:hypothetical protein
MRELDRERRNEENIKRGRNCREEENEKGRR